MLGKLKKRIRSVTTLAYVFILFPLGKFNYQAHYNKKIMTSMLVIFLLGLLWLHGKPLNQ